LALVVAPFVVAGVVAEALFYDYWSLGLGLWQALFLWPVGAVLLVGPVQIARGVRRQQLYLATMVLLAVVGAWSMVVVASTDDAQAGLGWLYAPLIGAPIAGLARMIDRLIGQDARVPDLLTLAARSGRWLLADPNAAEEARVFLRGVDREDAGVHVRELLVDSGFVVERTEVAEIRASLQVPHSGRMRLTTMAWTVFNVGTGTYETTVPWKVQRLVVELTVGAGGTVVRLRGTRYGVQRVLPKLTALEADPPTSPRAQPIMAPPGLPRSRPRLAAMGDGPSSLRLGWAVGAVVLGLWTFLGLLGAGVSLVSGNMAGFGFGLAWALCGYWFTRGMVERARPTPPL